MHLHRATRILISSDQSRASTVRAGHQPGVYTSWDECSVQVKGFPGAQHKKFPTRAEAEAFVQGDDRLTSAAGPSKAGISSIPQNKRDNGAESAGLPPSKRQRLVVGDDGVQAKPDVSKVPAGGSSKRRVYCDGSSRGNGKVGATAGIGVFWSHEEGAKCVVHLHPFPRWADTDSLHCRNLSERLPGKLQTNNRAEMYAS